MNLKASYGGAGTDYDVAAVYNHICKTVGYGTATPVGRVFPGIAHGARPGIAELQGGYITRYAIYHATEFITVPGRGDGC